MCYKMMFTRKIMNASTGSMWLEHMQMVSQLLGDKNEIMKLHDFCLVINFYLLLQVILTGPTLHTITMSLCVLGFKVHASHRTTLVNVNYLN